MDNYEKIKMDFSLLIEKLNKACANQGIAIHDIEKKSEILYHYKFGNGGIIEIFNTKNGYNLHYKHGKMQDQGKLILDEAFSNQSGEIEQILGTYAKYQGILDKYDTIEQFRDELIAFTKEIGAIVNNKELNPYAIFSADISRNHEKITVHIYKKNVLLQGKNYFLWDEICTWIERELEAPVNEILVRVTGDKNIFGKITDSKGKGVIEEAEAQLKSRIKDAYDFLFEHDKKFLNSAICLILYDNELPEYSCIAISAFKGLEGYFRKVVAEFIGKRDPDAMAKVYNPQDSFGWLFNLNMTGTYSLVTKYVDSSNLDVSRAFERLYLIYKDERNPYCHSTGIATRTCDTMEEAKNLVDSVLSSINQTFTIFNR